MLQLKINFAALFASFIAGFAIAAVFPKEAQPDLPTNNENAFLRLPHELHLEVFKYLDGSAMRSLAGVSKQMHTDNLEFLLNNPRNLVETMYGRRNLNAEVKNSLDLRFSTEFQKHLKGPKSVISIMDEMYRYSSKYDLNPTPNGAFKAIRDGLKSEPILTALGES